MHSSPKARQAKGKARLERYQELLKQSTDQRDLAGEIFVPPGPELAGRVIEARNVQKGYGDRLLMDGVSFSVPRGAIVGIIGPNGAGKSTLLRMIMGQEEPDKGELVLGDSVKLAYVDQSRDALSATKTVFEEVWTAWTKHLQLGKKVVNSRAYLAGFAFKGSDQQKKVKDLSGGERNRIHLAKMLRRVETCCF